MCCLAGKARGQCPGGDPPARSGFADPDTAKQSVWVAVASVICAPGVEVMLAWLAVLLPCCSYVCPRFSHVWPCARRSSVQPALAGCGDRGSRLAPIGNLCARRRAMLTWLAVLALPVRVAILPHNCPTFTLHWPSRMLRIAPSVRFKAGVLALLLCWRSH